jgi:hypothetical protein
MLKALGQESILGLAKVRRMFPFHYRFASSDS